MNARSASMLVPLFLLALPLTGCATPEVEGGVALGEYDEGGEYPEECRERIRDLEHRLQECREAREGEYREYREAVPGWSGTQWGMGPDAVRSKLPDAHGETRTLQVDRRIADRPARVELDFGATGLERVTVLFFPGSPGRATVRDFDDVRNLLRQKYGAPDEETSSSDRPNGSEAAVVIELGATWYRSPTRIVLGLADPSGRPRLTLTYARQDAAPAPGAPRRSSSLEGL